MPAVTVEDDALLGVLVAFRAMDKELKRETQRRLRSTALPLFQKAYTQRPRGAQQTKAAGRGSMSLTQAGRGQLKGYTTGSKVLSGGLDAAGGNWPWIEFGSKKAHAQRGQLPRWQKGGRIFYSATKATLPVVQRVYMRTVYDLLREAGAEDG